MRKGAKGKKKEIEHRQERIISIKKNSCNDFRTFQIECAILMWIFIQSRKHQPLSYDS